MFVRKVGWSGRWGWEGGASKGEGFEGMGNREEGGEGGREEVPGESLARQVKVI